MVNYCKSSNSSKKNQIFVVWQKMQAVRGMQRRSMAVIDFGETRFAVNADLDSFTALEVL